MALAWYDDMPAPKSAWLGTRGSRTEDSGTFNLGDLVSARVHARAGALTRPQPDCEGSVHGELQAQAAFEAAFRAKGVDREEKLATLQRSYDITVLCDAARLAFLQNGNQDRMSMLAQLLSETWPRSELAIARFIRDGYDEVEYMVPTIVSIARRDARASAFIERLGLHPAVSVRLRLLSEVEDFDSPGALGVLRTLENDIDEDVREAAHELLSARSV